MSKKKLRVGVIGCGAAAKIGHLPTYQKSPLSKIIAIADPIEAHLKKVQDLYDVPKAYNNPDELLDDPDVDAVSICSPHWAHLNQVLRAAKNGKHVLCEKPLGLNLEEIDKMIKAVEKNKIFFQTATQKRFDHGFQYLKEQIMKKTIGDIFHVSIFWYHSMPDLGPNPKKEFLEEIGMWRLTDERCGGGDLLDH
jgi:predicted dehydrogenase